MGHHHGVEADIERVSNNFSQIIEGKEGDLSGSDLDLAAWSQLASDEVELLPDFGEGEWLCVIGVRSEIAAGAGEVAALHHVVGRSAGDGGLAGELATGL